MDQNCQNDPVVSPGALFFAGSGAQRIVMPAGTEDLTSRFSSVCVVKHDLDRNLRRAVESGDDAIGKVPADKIDVPDRRRENAVK